MQYGRTNVFSPASPLQKLLLALFFRRPHSFPKAKKHSCPSANNKGVLAGASVLTANWASSSERRNKFRSRRAYVENFCLRGDVLIYGIVTLFVDSCFCFVRCWNFFQQSLLVCFVLCHNGVFFYFIFKRLQVWFSRAVDGFFRPLRPGVDLWGIVHFSFVRSGWSR